MGRKPSPWIRTRKIIQGVSLVCWIILWITTARLAWPVKLVRLPVLVDPLLALAQGLAGKVLVAGMFFSLITLVLTLIFGRAWCGWVCPVGTVLDLFPFHRRSQEVKPVPQAMRKGKFLLLMIILIAAIFGNLTFLFLDPITLWVRTLTGGFGAVFNTAFTAAEEFLADFSWLEPALQWLDQALRPALFPAETVGARFTGLSILLFAGLILLNLIAERFWCRYLCPLGGFLGLVSKLSLVKRRVDSGCKSCGQCSKICPTGTINPERGYISDPSECILCMNCLDSCPISKIEFRPGLKLPDRQTYDPDRRDLLITGAVTLFGLAILETDTPFHMASTNLIRPPGATNDDLLQKCLRCGLCMRACPTGALQASIREAGLSGLFTPLVVPRLGYCQFSCNNCGQVCPVGAIPALPLEEKQKQVIGQAFIDENRCLPWADAVSCIVCEEMCPLPEKAIFLEEKRIPQQDGSEKTIKLPHVKRDLCIGCGICEYKCPRSGEAAIRVYRVD